MDLITVIVPPDLWTGRGDIFTSSRSESSPFISKGISARPILFTFVEILSNESNLNDLILCKKKIQLHKIIYRRN